MSTVSKGKIVERIAALMHDQPGVEVKRNQFLLPKSGKGRRREIDVLLTGSLAGHPIRIAIECKNEKTAIGSPDIDAFCGKLEYLGLSPQNAIYISASGYTTGAIERAEDAGIRALTLRGLTDKDIFSSITGAFQSIIYLLLQMVNVTMTTQEPPDTSLGHEYEANGFYTKEGKCAALWPDLVWQAWLTDGIPTSLGEHTVVLPLPDNLYQMRSGRFIDIQTLGATVRVLGLVVTLKGNARQYTLVNAADELVQKSLVEVSFEADTDAPETQLPVTAISTEEELQAFLLRPEAVQLTIGRLKLPRISNGSMYWPPSERVARILEARWRAFEAEGIPDPRPFDLQGIEGTDLKTVWEPIWQNHPAGRKRQ